MMEVDAMVLLALRSWSTAGSGDRAGAGELQKQGTARAAKRCPCGKATIRRVTHGQLAKQDPADRISTKHSFTISLARWPQLRLDHWVSRLDHWVSSHQVIPRDRVAAGCWKACMFEDSGFIQGGPIGRAILMCVWINTLASETTPVAIFTHPYCRLQYQ